MNSNQIKQIEKKLSVSLPETYRNFLKSPPSILAAALRQEEKENPGQTMLFLDAEHIIDSNQLMRDPDHPGFFGFGPTDDPVPWPDEYFIIGSDVGGNYYCIKPATGKTAVYFWYQGDTILKRYAKDLSAYIRKIFQLYGDFASQDYHDE